MPSKRGKYNARFPAGRIKKIMQTDEEVGKVAQAVPIIISRTLELFVESLLSKAMQVTVSRNAKTLSPSHVKQCILAESRFDFLRDLVKNIPDVSAAEEKELLSEENSPNTSRFAEITVPPRRVVRLDSNSSSSSDRIQHTITSRDLIRAQSSETDLVSKPQTVTTPDAAIDLTKKPEATLRTANFYNETLSVTEEFPHRSVITINPTYASPQPSTSSYTIPNPLEQRIQTPVPKIDKPIFSIGIRPLKTSVSTPTTPVAPVLNIDFTKNTTSPEIKVLDSSAAKIVGVRSEPSTPTKTHAKVQRQTSKTHKSASKVESRASSSSQVVIDHFSSGNLQIDEDYDT